MSPTPGGIRPLVYFDPAKTNYQDTAKTTKSQANGDVLGWPQQYGTLSITGVSQPTTDNKPTLRLNVQNTQPAWLFDGTNDHLQGPFGSTISQPFTIFAVSALDSSVINNNSNPIIIDGSVSTNRAILFKSGTPNPDAFGIFSGTELDSPNPANANWIIWTAVFNGASSQFWINGVSQNSGNAGTNSLTGMTIGSQYLPINGQWKGYIGPILIYPGNLSSADKNWINRHLVGRYGITYTAIP